MLHKFFPTTTQVLQPYNRPLSSFYGSGVVIGCSHNHRFCDRHLHRHLESFYTIDINAEQKPDLVFDITGTLPREFNNRFKLTLVEYLDAIAYGQNKNGFDTILALTNTDGFILIAGCPRQKEYRGQLCARNLKYIEIAANQEIILIPKNQRLSAAQVQEQIKNLHPDLLYTIKLAIGDTQERDWHYCEEPYASMPTISEYYRLRIHN